MGDEQEAGFAIAVSLGTGGCVGEGPLVAEGDWAAPVSYRARIEVSDFHAGGALLAAA